jgi:AraC-like DNA-binding protein
LNFNVFNSVILAGVIQGFVFGGLVLFSAKYKHKSVYFLTALIIVYSLNNLMWYLEDVSFISTDKLYSHYYIPFNYLLPPLLYFYVSTYLNKDHVITKKETLLWLPFIISFSLSILYKALSAKGMNSFTEGLRMYLEAYDELLSALFHSSMIVVLFKVLKNYKSQDFSGASSSITLQLKWLRQTLILLLILIVLWIILTVLFIYFPGQISFYPLWIGIAILIYWLGHIGIYKFGIDKQREQIRFKNKQKNYKGPDVKSKNLIIERLKTYLIDEKRFLDPNLTLEKTAETLELSRGHLSKIINTELDMSFKDYINSLRVEEAKTYLLDDDFSNYTLVAIGLEAGFNSKSTFNSSFKKITGETPSQYKQRHIN